MSAATANATAVAPSTMDTMKQVALETANWMGHTVHQFGSNIQALALRIVEFVKPLFQNIRQMLVSMMDNCRKFCACNPDVAKALGVGLPIVALIGLFVYSQSGGETSPEAPAATATATA